MSWHREWTVEQIELEGEGTPIMQMPETFWRALDYAPRHDSLFMVELDDHMYIYKYTSYDSETKTWTLMRVD